MFVCVLDRTHSFQQGLVQFQTVCILWFQKLPVCDECENCVFLKTLLRLSVLAPVFSSFQNWQFLNQSAKLLPKIETYSTATVTAASAQARLQSLAGLTAICIAHSIYFFC